MFIWMPGLEELQFLFDFQGTLRGVKDPFQSFSILFHISGHQRRCREHVTRSELMEKSSTYIRLSIRLQTSISKKESQR